MMDGFLFWPFAAAFAGVWMLVGILFLIFWIWMIVDCAKREFKNSVEKIIWLLVIVIGQWVGALVYFIVINNINKKGLFK